MHPCAHRDLPTSAASGKPPEKDRRVDSRDGEQWGEDDGEKATGWGGGRCPATRVRQQEPATTRSSVGTPGTGAQLRGDPRPHGPHHGPGGESAF